MNSTDYTMRNCMSKRVMKKQFAINPQKIESWLEKNKTKSFAKDSDEFKYIGGCMTIPFG